MDVDPGNDTLKNPNLSALFNVGLAQGAALRCQLLAG